jgi:hypothetical protein
MPYSSSLSFLHSTTTILHPALASILPTSILYPRYFPLQLSQYPTNPSRYDNNLDKREPDPHPEQRPAKAPRLGDRQQDISKPASVIASSSEFSDAPKSLHSPEESIVRTSSPSVAANTPQVAPPIVKPVSVSDPTDIAFRLPRPHATATLHTSASNYDCQEELIHRAQQPWARSRGFHQ